IIMQGLLVAGATLLLVRRFRAPFGSITFVLTGFALAMAVQSDFYFYAIGAFVVGLFVDTLIAVLGDRARDRVPYHGIGFTVALLFTAAFEATTVHTGGGSAWVWNLLLGAPMLAGSAGLLLAFCFLPGLDQVVPASPTGGAA
ncbi:MAG: hypothetical protein JO199_07685, partial [Candidatus Eremiobacteraeota bacterium]|nr:hypothetical protein [Candidatus Eremiobacteraeota bacterium]